MYMKSRWLLSISLRRRTCGSSIASCFIFTNKVQLTTVCSSVRGMKAMSRTVSGTNMWFNMCNFIESLCRFDSNSKTQLGSASTHVDKFYTDSVMLDMHTKSLIDMDSFGPSERALIEEWKNKFRQSKCYGEAVFVLGAMGAGKSTVITQEFRKHPLYGKYAYVDSDELMEQLDGFDPKNVEELYPIARGLAIHLTDWLLNENISFVAEGTCVKYTELEDYMERLKQKGYSIKVKHVNNLPLETVLQRTRRRSRTVQDEVVKSIYYGSFTGLNELKRMNEGNNNALFEEI